MSTLNTGTVQNNTGTGAPLFKNNAGTEIGQLAKVWVNFNGTGTVAIRDDFNVTSITDNGTGNYTVSYTNAMPNANYAAVATIGSGSIASSSESTQVINLTTTGVQVLVGSDGSSGSTYTYQDASTVCVVVFGD